MRGNLSNGFEYAVDMSVLDNMELIEAIADVDGGNVLKLPKLVELILGSDQKARLYESVRDKSGRVPTAKVTEAVKEIFEALGAVGKKS